MQTGVVKLIWRRE